VEVVIRLESLRVLGVHGVLPEEQDRAQPFEIDLCLTADVTGTDTDQLDDTVDYGTVADAVERIVRTESHRLLERLADRIASECGKDDRVRRVDVTVRKLRPPLPVDIGSVAVSLTVTFPAT
jgi:dihydroneopterin aldolase